MRVNREILAKCVRESDGEMERENAFRSAIG